MWPLKWKGASGFSAWSTAEEVTEGVDGAGLTAIVTGATSGIGTETARVLALRGVRVIMGVRNVSAGNEIKRSIIEGVPAAQIDVFELDLSSMSSVARFTSKFKSLNFPLNILINNAGVFGTPFSLSHDGIEMQFATNHIGHFLLTYLLLDNMKKTSIETGIEGRIVNVSSMAHRITYSEGIHFDKINDESTYSGWFAYAQSKFANILHANELSRCFKEDGVKITANSLHPGLILTNLPRHRSFLNVINNTLGKLLLQNVQQGAATTCYVALHPQVEGLTGRYFSNSNLSKSSSKCDNAELAKKLWDFSLSLITDRLPNFDDLLKSNL
ncbi:putative very-long-chain 3-oxoacyl-CoA reductase [Dioscorea sansibarensis]